MARSGKGSFEPNPKFFDTFMRDEKVEALVDDIAEDAMGIIKSTAPVNTGEYLDRIHLEHYEANYRRTTRVVGDDPKTLLIESKTGNMARGLKRVTKR